MKEKAKAPADKPQRPTTPSLPKPPERPSPTRAVTGGGAPARQPSQALAPTPPTRPSPTVPERRDNPPTWHTLTPATGAASPSMMSKPITDIPHGDHQPHRGDVRSG